MTAAHHQQRAREAYESKQRVRRVLLSKVDAGDRAEIDPRLLIRGGQGRSDDEITATGKALCWLLMMVVGGLAWCGIVWLGVTLLGLLTGGGA